MNASPGLFCGGALGWTAQSGGQAAQRFGGDVQIWYVMLSQPVGELTLLSNLGSHREPPPQHPCRCIPQRGASRGHLCISQVLRVLSHPEQLKRRCQLWLWAAAELTGGLLMMFMKTLNEDHTQEAQVSDAS